MKNYYFYKAKSYVLRAMCKIRNSKLTTHGSWLTALLILSPFLSFSQKNIELDIVIPERWQIDTIYLTNDIMDYDWWKRFEDPTLDSLIMVALSNNYNLQSIEATLEKSRFLYQQSKSAFYPNLSLDAQYDLSETS